MLGGRVQTRSDQLTRRVALAADQAVVVGTPVDTGRARSNWIVAINSPAEQAIEAYRPGEGRSTEGANTAAALAQGEAVIRSYRGEGSIHITNNVPYIQKLNDGSSAQAPAGFVEDAVLLAVEEVTRADLLGDN